MVQALAPRLSRWWLALALLAAAPMASFAQAPKKDAPPAKADAKAADAEKKDDDDQKEGVVDKSKMEKQETSEVFEDPRAKPLLKNTFKEYPDAKPPLTASDIPAMRNMAANVVAFNRDTASRFLDQMVADLAKHVYIKAVIDPDQNMRPGDSRVRAIEKASQNLMELLVIAKDKKNAVFLSQFVPLLFAKLTPLLEGHLLTRVEASIVLASAATPAQVDLFVKQINDPKQVVWVKHWSARALTNATNEGKATLDIGTATAATAALVGFLEKEPGAPWPVKLRVLEALGSIRLASTTGVSGKPDVAALVMLTLSDPNVKIDVRARAAWTLGMLTIPASIPTYNFKLATYQTGRLAADIGDKILADYGQRKDKFTRQNDQSRYLTGLLLYQVYPALAGEDDVPNSGLLHSRHPAALASRPFMSGLDEQLKNLGRAAGDLLTAGGGQVKEASADLEARVVELKSFLEKNRPGPAETELYPGGPKIAINPTQVAGAPPRGK
jgi:hypothetical protein